MDFEQTISFLLAQVATAHRNRLEKKMDEIGLHSGQVFILFELWKQNGLSQIKLANNLNISPPTVNKMLKGLAENGFVSTGRFENDGRTTRAHLLPKGEEIRDLIEIQWRELEAEFLAPLTETEKLMLWQLMGKLRENLFSRT